MTTLTGGAGAHRRREIEEDAAGVRGQDEAGRGHEGDSSRVGTQV